LLNAMFLIPSARDRYRTDTKAGISYRRIMIKRSRRLKVRIGQRVSRKDSAELGTVLQANSPIKVKWDGGRTSYFYLSRPSNVRVYKA
jgi:hypothetical protein